MDFAIPICVFTANQKNFTVGNSESTASPKWVFHTHGQHLPLVFLNLVHLDGVIYFLFCTSEETSKSINVLISHWTCTQIMSFIFHRCHLVPFIFPNIVFFDRAESLFTWEATKNKDTSFTYRNCMCISTLGHLCLVQDLILLGHKDSGILFWWRATPGNQNFCRT